MSQLTGINLSVELGPLSNVPLTVTPGWAMYYTARELWHLVRQPGGTTAGLRYSEELDALILDWQPQVWGNNVSYLKTMTLAGLDAISGDWRLCNIPGKPTHYEFYDGSDGATGSITSRTMLFENPNFVCSFYRYPESHPDYDGPRRWTLSWGLNDCVLEWATDFYGNEATPNTRSVQPLVVFTDPAGVQHTLDLDDNEKAAFLTTLEFEWYVYTMGDSLVILSTWMNRPWVIRSEDGQDWSIASNVWSFDAITGPCAVNVSEVEFDTTLTAYCETPWIDLGYDYDDDTFAAQWYVKNAASDYALTASVIETRGTERRFGLTFGTYLSTRTPFVQGVQFAYNPTFAAATDDWTDVTCYVLDWNVNLTPPMQPSSANLTLSLLKALDESGQMDMAHGMTLDDLLQDTYGVSLWGAWACRIAVGHVYADGSDDQRTVLTGILQLNASERAVDISRDVLTGTVFDRMAMLGTRELWYAPCGIDQTVCDALTLWAMWSGIPVEDIDATDNGRMVNTRSDSYNNPPWRPEFGANGLQTMRQLAERRGYQFWFDGDGVLHIAPRLYYATPVASYSADESFPGETAIQEVKAEQDMSQAVSLVYVRGKREQLSLEDRLDPDLLYWVYDPNALELGTEVYTGQLQSQTIVDDNLASQEEVTAACWEAFLWRNTGQPDVTLTTAYAGWDINAGDHIFVDDAYHGFSNREFRVTQVDLRPDAHLLIRVQLTLQSIEA
jgi:hypothetical protein